MAHFNNIDKTGHTEGFSSKFQYLEQISLADKLIGELLSAISQKCSTTNEEWLVIVTSDHGGHEFTHDTDLILDRVVPFVVSLPCSSSETQAKLVDLREPVYHFDTMPTILQWLGIPIPPGLDGVVQVISKL